MSHPVIDPLSLGQRVVALLETGLRTATYKLATLMALIDYALEHAPEDETAELIVPMRALSERVIDLYWPQVRPFDGASLRQSTQSRERILEAVRDLRSVTGVGDGGLSATVAAARHAEAYEKTVAEVMLCLARQPLHRLQRLPGAARSDCFLYDDSFLHDAVSRKSLRAHGEQVVLFPGVAHGLARLAGLLRPALEIMWVDDIRRWNKFIGDNSVDVASHLFGRDRTALRAVRGPLHAAFGPRCFYCAEPLTSSSPIDHVLPWALVGIDGLANLVPACVRCNSDKRHALPSPAIVERVLGRDRAVLEQIASATRWPTEFDRVVAVTRGVYRNQPVGSPTWDGRKRIHRIDLSQQSWYLSLGS